MKPRELLPNMRRPLPRLALLVLTLSALTSCGNEEQGPVSAPGTAATKTVAASEVLPTTPPSTVISAATLTIQPSPTTLVATTVAIQPPTPSAIEPTREVQKASVIFFSAPN